MDNNKTENEVDVSLQEQGEVEVTIRGLLEAGAHFGHEASRWNPKMKRYIFEPRHGIHIIDLAKTLQQIRKARKYVSEVAAERKSILFVGTKKQAKVVVKELAEICGEYYISERWLGGTLTNLVTIRESVKKLDRLEKRIATGSEGLTKKELSLLTKQQLKLERNLSGIRAMRKLPGLLIVVDPTKERLAVAEARKLSIPIMALIDTNCNPDLVDHVIACNDDSLKSIRLILQTLAYAILDKKKQFQLLNQKQGEGVEERMVEKGEQVAEKYQS